MQNLNEQAAYFRVALELGVCLVSDVIHWADSMIAQLDKPPLDLIELSLLGTANPHVVSGKLTELAAGIPAKDVLRKVLGVAHKELREHPEFGPIIARGLYQIYVESDYHVPEDLSPMAGFDDQYSLARQAFTKRRRRFLMILLSSRAGSWTNASHSMQADVFPLTSIPPLNTGLPEWPKSAIIYT